jgi:hypothetical protein
MRTMVTGTFDQIVDLSEGNTTFIRLEDPFIANLQLILFGSFSNTWTTQEQRHPELNLRNATDIYLPFPRIELYKKLPIYSLPYAWNETGDLRYQRNAFTYQVTLREFLTAQAGSEPPG